MMLPLALSICLLAGWSDVTLSDIWPVVLNHALKHVVDQPGLPSVNQEATAIGMMYQNKGVHYGAQLKGGARLVAKDDWDKTPLHIFDRGGSMPWFVLVLDMNGPICKATLTQTIYDTSDDDEDMSQYTTGQKIAIRELKEKHMRQLKQPHAKVRIIMVAPRMQMCPISRQRNAAPNRGDTCDLMQPPNKAAQSRFGLGSELRVLADLTTMLQEASRLEALGSRLTTRNMPRRTGEQLTRASAGVWAAKLVRSFILEDIRGKSVLSKTGVKPFIQDWCEDQAEVSESVSSCLLCVCVWVRRWAHHPARSATPSPQPPCRAL